MSRNGSRYNNPAKGQDAELFVLYAHFMAFEEWNHKPTKENAHKLAQKYKRVLEFYDKQ